MKAIYYFIIVCSTVVLCGCSGSQSGELDFAKEAARYETAGTKFFEKAVREYDRKYDRMQKVDSLGWEFGRKTGLKRMAALYVRIFKPRFRESYYENIAAGEKCLELAAGYAPDDAARIYEKKRNYLYSLSDSYSFRYGNNWSRLQKEYPAQRGRILDRNCNVLAEDVLRYEIRLDCALNDDKNWNDRAIELAKGLEKFVTDTSAAGYYAKIMKGRKSGNRYLSLCKCVTSEQKDSIMRFPFFKEDRYYGGGIVNRAVVRSYPYGRLARRAIGIYREGSMFDNIGIEGSCNDVLYGVDGFDCGNGKVKREKVDGQDVLLTLDMDVQRKADEALRVSINNNDNIEGGCVVIADVKTGEIMAMVNLMKDAEGRFDEVYNLAIARTFEPGDVFKPVSLMALAEDGVEISSDTDVAETAIKVYDFEVQKYFERVKENEMEEPHEFDIEGLASPSYPGLSARAWGNDAFGMVTEGDGVDETCVQILAFYNALAGDGKYVWPTLVMNKTGYTKEICTDATAKSVIAAGLHSIGPDGLIGCSGVMNHVLDTSIRDPYDEYSTADGQSQYYSCFAGFFPKDAPKYSIVCMTYSGLTKDVNYGKGIPEDVAVRIAGVL